MQRMVDLEQPGRLAKGALDDDVADEQSGVAADGVADDGGAAWAVPPDAGATRGGAVDPPSKASCFAEDADVVFGRAVVRSANPGRVIAAEAALHEAVDTAGVAGR